MQQFEWNEIQSCKRGCPAKAEDRSAKSSIEVSALARFIWTTKIFCIMCTDGEAEKATALYIFAVVVSRKVS